MARPSKLTEKQWAEVQRRVLAGEKVRPLAREYKVSEAAIRARVTTQVKHIKAVANQIVETEKNFSSLPISAQITARNLASDLMAISDHLASAAKFGAMTAHRLSYIANTQVEKIDEVDPLSADSIESIKGIGVLNKLANDSSEIGLNLLRANKERIDAINNPERDSGQLLSEIAALLPD